MVGTREAAKILGIGERRLRYLLADTRVQGAFKVGRIWVIPLINGIPVVRNCDRGPKPTWKQLKRQALSRIHVNKYLFGKKDNTGSYVPVIKVNNSQGGYCHRVEIHGHCSIMYNFDHPFDSAKVWIETDSEPIIIGEKYTYAEIQEMLKAAG
jgi:hypothetical protein